MHTFQTVHQKALEETLSIATPPPSAISQNPSAKMNQHILMSVPETME